MNKKEKAEFLKASDTLFMNLFPELDRLTPVELRRMTQKYWENKE